MDEAFEAWFKELYIRDGFVSSKVELYAAWRAAMLAEREACAKACEEVDLHSGDHLKNSDPRMTCAAAIRAR